MNVIKKGDRVAIHFTGRLENGTVFDSSHGREPLEFEAGGEQMMPGLSKAVVGMHIGEAKTVTIPPEEAFGERREGLQQRIPLEAVSEEIRVGDQIHAQLNNRTLVFWVIEVGDDFAVIDPNHPLAGHTLIFDVELVS